MKSRLGNSTRLPTSNVGTAAFTTAELVPVSTSPATIATAAFRLVPNRRGARCLGDDDLVLLTIPPRQNHPRRGRRMHARAPDLHRSSGQARETRPLSSVQPIGARSALVPPRSAELQNPSKGVVS